MKSKILSYLNKQLKEKENEDFMLMDDEEKSMRHGAIFILEDVIADIEDMEE